jgi:toxin ParE1/3/4
MRLEVFLTEDAERDLEELYAYLAEFDSPKNAAAVLDRVLEVAERLATSREDASPPKELRGLGIDEYPQTVVKPYRMIHRVTDKRVVIYIIADGRRDMQSLLARRLLRG